MIFVILTVSLAVRKHHMHNQVEKGKGLFDLNVQITLHHWRKSGQELKQR